MTKFLELIDLAAQGLGGAVIYANDDFFAEKENLLKPKPAVFLEHEYTDRGKWMDGWESRRRRVEGHDFALIRLGLSGIIRGVVVDTAFFRGNFPEACSIEGTVARADASPEQLLADSTRWVEILPHSPLMGDAKNNFEIHSEARFTHLRLNIFPDGGVARLRVHGEVVPDWQKLGRGGAEIDVAAVETGARVLSCSDMFFGVRHNLTMPGRAANMGDGWETKRRRGLFGPNGRPQNDWALIELCAESELRKIEVDTNHFKGNFPDQCMIEGCVAVDPTAPEVVWREIVPKTKLQAHTRHYFEEEMVDRGPFTHLRLNIYPDGGVSRLRVHGVITRAGALGRRLGRFNNQPREEAVLALLACCGSTVWANAMADARPFASVEAVLESADAIWSRLGPADYLEAFEAHPRIGEKKAEKTHGERAQSWAENEQSGVRAAADDALLALAEANRLYDQKFGHIFIVCATGKTAPEMLGILQSRMFNEPAAELLVAAEEQRKITRLRLEKLLDS